MHVLQTKRSVMLSSSLEFAWKYWISLLAPLHSYVLLVFCYIRRCFVFIYMFLHAGTLMGLDACTWLTKSKAKPTVVLCHHSIQMFSSQMRALSSLTASSLRSSVVPFPDLPSLFPFLFFLFLPLLVHL